jgi:hypothetical protein
MVQAGALAFGVVIGWFVYFVNRYRSEVALADVAVILAAIGGGAVLDLFPEQSTLFGYYGLGLALGFFAYFVVLVVLVRTNRDRGWTSEWFLDGRRPPLRSLATGAGTTAPQQGGTASKGMGAGAEDPSLHLGS